MRRDKHEPDFTERLAAQAVARRAQVERMRPRPAAPAPAEAFMLRQRAQDAARARHRLEREERRFHRDRKASFVAPEFAPLVIDVPAPPLPPPRVVVHPEPVRYAVGVDGVCQADRRRRMARRRAQMAAWKRDQWRAGNRSCTYCACALVADPQQPNGATVDHVDPLAEDGHNDVPENYAMACWTCNNRKGRMSAEAFRALLARERVAVAAE